MKNKITKILLALLLTAICGLTVVTAQTTERIQFPKGAKEVNLVKTIPGNTTREYVFWAKTGQEIGFTVTPKNPNANFSIEFVGEEVAAGNLFTMIAPRNGDYVLYVFNGERQSQTFHLDIGIDYPQEESNTNSSDNERVRFAPGETSAMLTRDIPGQETVTFVMNVKKGQVIEYTVGYDFNEKDVRVFLSEPGAQDFSKTSGPNARQTFTVVKNGDHYITINNTSGKKATVTLYLDIQ